MMDGDTCVTQRYWRHRDHVRGTPILRQERLHTFRERSERASERMTASMRRVIDTLIGSQWGLDYPFRIALPLRILPFTLRL